MKQSKPSSSPPLPVHEGNTIPYNEGEAEIKKEISVINTFKGRCFGGKLKDFVRTIIRDINQRAKQVSLSVVEKGFFTPKFIGKTGSRLNF